jgi:hypothetical protein
MAQTIPNELNLFETPSMNAPYQKVQFVEYRSASPLNDGGPIQFIIPPTANQFIDLRRSVLHVEAKVVRTDGKALDDAEMVAPINLPLHSFFSQVDVELQQHLVSSNQLYGYKAYIETLLGYNQEAQDTFLRSQGFAKDTSATVDEVTDFRKNAGIFTRFVTFGKNQTADMEGPLMADICQQDRFILNGVEINIKLWPARDTFALLTALDNKYEVHFSEVYLKVCKVLPMSSVTFGVGETLKEKPSLYPFVRTEMRAFQLQDGQLNFHLEDMFQQQVPTEVIVCMVSAKGFHGSYNTNPYSFNPFTITELGLYVDDESMPAKPLKMSFAREKKNYIEAYNMLFENPPEKGGPAITRDDFNQGYTIFRFRVTPEDVDSLPNSRGNVKLNGTFKEALKENITLIVIGKFHHILAIDNARSIKI